MFRQLTGTIALLALSAGSVSAIPSPFGRILPKTTPDEAITTSINDAYPVAHWLDWEEGLWKPEEATSFTLAPGYYHLTIRSYCLHAGTYGPTKGAGYLLAPLKGRRAGLIQAVLDRSAKHPEIDQPDVQNLLWDIEAGAKLSDWPPDFLNKVRPLLTPEDLVSLDVDPASIIDQFLPEDARRALQFYEGFRQKLVDPNATFQELEDQAVLHGEIPWGKGSQREVRAGNWSYAGNGFYMRTFPQDYTTTDVEVISPAPYQLDRDAKGRITRVRSGALKLKIEATYDDAPGRDSIPGHPDVHI